MFFLAFLVHSSHYDVVRQNNEQLSLSKLMIFCNLKVRLVNNTILSNALEKSNIDCQMIKQQSSYISGNTTVNLIMTSKYLIFV